MHDPSALAANLVLAVLLSVPIVVVLHGVTVSLVPRLRRLLAAPHLATVYAAWALLNLAGAQWTMSAAATVGLGDVQSGNLIRAAFLGLGLLIASSWVVAHGAAPLAALRRTPTHGFVLFGAWSGLTLAWSVSWPATAYKTGEFVATLLLVAVAVFAVQRAPQAQARLDGVKRLFDWQWSLTFLLLLTVGVGAVLWPDRAIGPGLSWLPWQVQGVLPSISSNGVGQLGALLGLVCSNRLLGGTRGRATYLFVGAVALAAMVLAQSRSALLALALGLVILLVFHRAWRWLPWLAALGVLTLATQLQAFVTAYLVRGRPMALETLTGRTTWWSTAADAMQARPLEGFGAFVGGKHVLDSAADQGPSTLHNAFIEAWAGSGAIGLALFAMAVVGTAAVLLRRRPGAGAGRLYRLLWAESAAVFALLLVRSVFSVAFLWPPMMTLAVLLVFLTYRAEPVPVPVRAADDAVP